MSCSVSHCASSIGLLFAVFLSLPTKSSLIDLALLSPGERHAVGLQLEDGFRGLSTHVVDSILVAKPIAALDSVVAVPPPVVSVHVSEGSIDTALGRNCMGPGGEQFRDACSFEALLDETKGSPESCSSCSHNDGIESVIDDSVFFEEGVLTLPTSLPPHPWRGGRSTGFRRGRCFWRAYFCASWSSLST